jgi:hypothetical protein
MARPNSKLCVLCTQDVIRDCAPPEGDPCFMTTIAKLANMAEHVGLGCSDLIDMFNRGVSVGELIDLIGRAARQQHSTVLPV